MLWNFGGYFVPKSFQELGPSGEARILLVRHKKLVFNGLTLVNFVLRG